MRGWVAFLENLMLTGGGTIETPSFWIDCYQCVLSILVTWTDKSVEICEQLSSSGLVLFNINFVKKVCYQNSEIEVKEEITDNVIC